MQPLRPMHPRCMRLLFAVSALEMTIGLAIHGLPGEFDTPVYAGLRPFFPELSTLLIAGAAALLLLLRFPMPRWVQRLSAVIPAAPLAVLTWYLGAAGLLGAPLFYGPMAVGVLMAPWYPADSQSALDPFNLVVAVSEAAIGLLMVLAPQRFPPGAYPALQQVKLAVGLAGVTGAVLLLLPLFPAARRHRLLSGRALRLVALSIPLAFAHNGLKVGTLSAGIAWGLIALILAAGEGLPAWIEQQAQPPDSVDLNSPFSLITVERLTEFWSWLLAVGILLLSAVAPQDAVAPPLAVDLFVLSVAVYNAFAHWVFQGVGAPEDRLFLHLVFVTVAVGMLMDDTRPIGQIFQMLLVAPPVLAARALGFRRGVRLLLLAGVMSMLDDVRTVLLTGGVFPWIHELAQLMVLWIAGWAGVRSAAQQRDKLEELARAEAALERQVEQLKLMDRIGAAIRASLDPDQVLTATAGELAAAMQASRCNIRLRQPGGRYLLAHAYAAHSVPAGQPDQTRWHEALAEAVDRGAIVRIPRVFPYDPAWNPLPVLPEGVVKSALVVPILSESGPLGAIELQQCGTNRPWTENETAFVSAISSQLAVAVAHARIHRELADRHTELQAAHEELQAQGEELHAQQDELLSRHAQLEEALAATRQAEVANARLVAVLEATPDIISIATLDGRIIYTNQAGMRIMSSPDGARRVGYSRPEWARRLIIEEGVPAAIAHGSWKGENVILDREGREMPVLQHILYHPPSDDEPGFLSTVIRDITEQKRQEEALRESEERFRGAFDQSALPGAMITPTGVLIRVNPKFCQLVGYTEAELVGRPIFELTDPAYHAPTQAFLDAALAGGLSAYQQEKHYIHKEGMRVHVMVTSSLVRDSAGNPIHFVGQMEDIGLRKLAEAELLHLANFDTLTNLYNRRRFQQELERVVAEPHDCGTRGAVLFMDLDQFKYVNDSLGHQAGDELLQSVACILRQRLRESDIIARLGGDEFAVLIPRTDCTGARATAERILAALRSHIELVAGQPITITASIGIAMFPDHATQSDELLARADMAMYRAKEQGRNNYSMYTPDRAAEARVESKLTWERRIRDALEQDGLVLHCQPIVDLETGAVRQFELLLRMRDEYGGLILPGHFLDVAERFGLIHAIDRWVVRQAIGLIAKARDHGRALCLEVNLSGKAFGDPTLLGMIRDLLEQTRIDPALLVLEITETAAIADSTEAFVFVETLKNLGCRFALDDFGSGFSSFHYLKILPVDYLKIDGGFISSLCENPVDQHLVKAMVEVARGLGKETVAEFVGDDATAALLRSYGVNLGQGYHLGRPFPVEEIWVKYGNK